MRRAALGFIILTVFIDMLGVGLIVPVLPFIAVRFGAGAFAIGALSLSFAAAQFVATPVLGALSDHIGRRPVLVLSLFGSSIAYVIFGLANALWLLFAARIVDGFTGGNISTAQAYIADITAPEDRAKTMGLMGAALGLGFVLGPAIGGALARTHLMLPPLVAGGLAFLNAIYGTIVLPESLPPERRTPHLSGGRALNPLPPVAQAFAEPGLRPLMVTTFLVNFALTGLQSNFAYFALVRLGYGPSQVAIVFVFLGLLHILAQGVLVRRAVDAWGDRPTLLIGLALGVIGYVLMALAHTAPVLYASIAVLAIGGGIGTPTLTAVISRRAGDRAQGVTLGSAQATAALSRIFGPLWAGFIFDAAGSGAPYATGAVAVAAALAAMALDRAPIPDSRRSTS